MCNILSMKTEHAAVFNQQISARHPPNVDIIVVWVNLKSPWHHRGKQNLFVCLPVIGLTIMITSQVLFMVQVSQSFQNVDARPSWSVFHQNLRRTVAIYLINKSVFLYEAMCADRLLLLGLSQCLKDITNVFWCVRCQLGSSVRVMK